MGKKSSKETSTSTSTPWAPAQPYILGAANTIQNTVNQHQPQLDSLTNDIAGRLPALWNQAGDSSMIQPGMNYANDVLGGKYLNANPFTDAMTARAGQDAANSVNSTFSMAGRTGSLNHATDLARGVAQAENGVMFGNYANERNNQNAAASMLPALNQSRFAGYVPALAATQLAGQLPFYGTQSMSALGGLLGGFGSQTGTQTKPGGWGTDLLSAGVSALPFIFSDIRLKTKVEKVGEFSDGLGIYTFAYKSDPKQTFKGVMAHEVKKLRPWAYVENYRGSGFDAVNYGAL